MQLSAVNLHIVQLPPTKSLPLPFPLNHAKDLQDIVLALSRKIDHVNC